MERERHIKSGPLLEVDFYPVTADGRRLPERAPKSKPSTKEQLKYNQNQAAKKLIRLVNANFALGDLFVHLTYQPEHVPKTEGDVRRDVQNYIRRIKRYRRKQGMSPMKYIYVIEKQICKSGKRKGEISWHVHMMMSEMDRNTAEDMWGKGVRVNADRFQPETFGPEAAARYISKDPQGSKRFVYSRNLDKPQTPPPRDGKITCRGVERMARERVDDAAYWERRYKGYRFLYCFPRLNPYNGHWYVSVVMYKAGAQAPPWSAFEE